MGTRTVTDTLRYLVAPWANQSVVFSLLTPIASVDGLYLPRSLTATTDENGAFSIALPVPDDANEAGPYTCLLPNGQTIPFTLSAGVGSVRLGSLLVEAISSASPNDLQVLIDNHAAVEASTTVLGHVTVDGTTITATDGVLAVAGGGSAPTNATYVTLTTNAALTGERVLTAGDNVTLTDGGAGGAATLAVPGVTALNPVRVYADGGALLNMPRLLVTDAHALNVGIVKFLYLHNAPAVTVTTFLSFCSTAAGGTIAAKCGLYSVAGNGNLTCIARSASSSALWKTNNTVNQAIIADNGAASPVSITEVTLTAGGSYAVALLQTGASSDPVLGGKWGINNALMAFAPTIAASISAQTDLQPTYTAGSLSTITSVAWAGIR